MTGTTPVQGYPYPNTTDFSDVQDSFRLASAIDADLRAEQAPFRAFMGRPSFIGRSTVTPSGFLAGSSNVTIGAIEWDNTGGLAVGSSVWTQPAAQQPSWWLFGATILVNIVSGTPVVGDLCEGQIAVTTVDQVTNLSSQQNFWQRNDETNTGGEWINMFGIASLYRGSVVSALNLNGTTQKAPQLGSRFWGMYLGPVT